MLVPRARSGVSPSKGACTNTSTSRSIISHPVSRSESASTFASLWRRASSAESGSVTTAQRTPGTLFAAIEMPIARAAHDDAAIGLSARYGFAHGVAILRIVDRRRIVRAEIENRRDPASRSICAMRSLIFVAGVIGAEGNTHGVEFKPPLGNLCRASTLCGFARSRRAARGTLRRMPGRSARAKRRYMKRVFERRISPSFRERRSHPT